MYDLDSLPTSMRTGWPWQSPESSERPASVDLESLPTISVVVPSYNQVEYLEQTIRSVLMQDYPKIELIIMDGGSTDGSVEILKQYDPWITHWESGRDHGQTHALCKGFRRSTGDWVGWQNSDDWYEPNAFWSLVDATIRYPETDLFYGPTRFTNAQGDLTRYATVHETFSLEKMIPLPYVFNQSAFFSQRIFSQGFFPDTRRQHMMDYDFIWRLVLAGFRFHFAPGVEANFRQQDASKTANQGSQVGEDELFDIYRMLYYHPQFDATLRPQARQGMRMMIHNAWAHRQYDRVQFRFDRALAIAGLRTVSPRTLLYRILASAPRGLTETARKHLKKR